MKILNCLILVAGVLLNRADAARKQPAIDTRRYANICLHRVPIKENDSRGHAILKTAIEVSSLSSILSRESPQHKAMCWMLYDDPLKLNPRSSRGRFLDRYGLVTFYLNTKGPGWVRSDHWLSKESECSWYGIKCNGSVPGLSSRVTSVDLSFNKVSGIIPAELGYLSELQELDLNGNELQGVVPQLIFVNLKKLQKLNLHMNDLFGQIPTEIGMLKNLKELTLFGNFFFGKVPTQLGNLKKLRILDLYANNLTGAIPTQLGDLKNLKEFHINDNELVGRMPREICKMKLEHLVSDCLGARPEVPCECCTVCCQGLPDPKCKDMKATSVKAVKKKK